MFNARINDLREISCLWAVQFHIYRFHDTLSLHTSFNTDSGVPTGLHYQVNRFKESIRNVSAYLWIKFESLIITAVEKANFGFVFYQGQLRSVKYFGSVNTPTKTKFHQGFAIIG